jgi:Glycosyl-transferase for dystroglycan
MQRHRKLHNVTSSDSHQQFGSVVVATHDDNESSAHQKSSSSSLSPRHFGRPPTLHTIPTAATPTVSVGHLIPPRKLGRVMSTPPSYSASIRSTTMTTARSGGSTLSVSQPQQLSEQQSRCISSSHSGSNTTVHQRHSPTKKKGLLLHTRSFDDTRPLPPSVSVAVAHIRHVASAEDDNETTPVSSSSSSPASTPKVRSSATSSTTSSTASVSSNDEENNEDPLFVTTHDRTTAEASRKQQPKRLQRSLSSDDYSNYHNDYDSKNDTYRNNDGTVYWMDTMVSSNQASSPPQDMKLTSVRKRPSPRSDFDHSHNNHFDHHTNLAQRSSPPSSSSTFLQQQQQSSMVQPNTVVGTPVAAHTGTSSSSMVVASFRSSMQQKNDRSGSFRRRKGTKNSTMRKSLLRNKSFLLLRYMYIQRYFSTKRRSVFVIYTIGILLLLLFMLSFSLSFLSSHRNTITKIFFSSSPEKLKTPMSGGDASVTTRNRRGIMLKPKAWNMFPNQKQQQPEKDLGATVSSSNDSSNDGPSGTTQQHEHQLEDNQQEDLQQQHWHVTSNNNKNTNTGSVIRTLRGRFKKHNVISQKATSADKNQQKKPNRWFGFSHLLLPPKNKNKFGSVTTANATLDAAALRGGKSDSIDKSPIVVDGKVYNFQQYTKFAPQCHTTANDNTISVNDIDFTIATQLSYNRLWMMEYHCVRWTQAMSLAIYVGKNESTTVTSDSIRQDMIQMGCSEQQDITIQVLSGYSDEEYPVNVLRNMALSKVRTTHVVYVDVDFWVSIDLYTILNQHREALLSNSKLALVVPAFQLSRQCKEWRDCREMNIPKMPHIKDELVDLMMKHQANAFDPSNRGGHGSTRYKDWLLQLEDELIPIDCVKSNRYEPYLVFRLCNDLPPFQESFTGYGKNKMTWMMQLRRTGYQLMQLGGAFAVHYPHLDSTARMHWNGGVDGSQLPKPHDTTVDLSKFKRGQIDETFVAFRHWLATSIPDNSVMPMCEDAQDDDQRLWIAPDKVIKLKST